MKRSRVEYVCRHSCGEPACGHCYFDSSSRNEHERNLSLHSACHASCESLKHRRAPRTSLPEQSTVSVIPDETMVDVVAAGIPGGGQPVTSGLAIRKGGNAAANSPGVNALPLSVLEQQSSNTAALQSSMGSMDMSAAEGDEKMALVTLESSAVVPQHQPSASSSASQLDQRPFSSLDRYKVKGTDHAILPMLMEMTCEPTHFFVGCGPVSILAILWWVDSHMEASVPKLGLGVSLPLDTELWFDLLNQPDDYKPRSSPSSSPYPMERKEKPKDKAGKEKADKEDAEYRLARCLYIHQVIRVWPPYHPLQTLNNKYFSSLNTISSLLRLPNSGWKYWMVYGHKVSMAQLVLEKRSSCIQLPAFDSGPFRYLNSDNYCYSDHQFLPRDLLAALCRYECDEFRCHPDPYENDRMAKDEWLTSNKWDKRKVCSHGIDSKFDTDSTWKQQRRWITRICFLKANNLAVVDCFKEAIWYQPLFKVMYEVKERVWPRSEAITFACHSYWNHLVINNKNQLLKLKECFDEDMLFFREYRPCLSQYSPQYQWLGELENQFKPIRHYQFSDEPVLLTKWVLKTEVMMVPGIILLPSLAMTAIYLPIKARVLIEGETIIVDEWFENRVRRCDDEHLRENQPRWMTEVSQMLQQMKQIANLTIPDDVVDGVFSNFSLLEHRVKVRSVPLYPTEQAVSLMPAIEVTSSRTDQWLESEVQLRVVVEKLTYEKKSTEAAHDCRFALEQQRCRERATP
jgi:hypothetical protein